MSAIDVQVRFAVEFALFLVSLAGVGFAFLRSDLLVERPAARVACALGFASLAAAAFCSGALIVDEADAPAVVLLRFAGMLLLAVASMAWRADRGGRDLLRIGVVCLALAEAIVLNDDTSTIADVARGLGALAIGACLMGASARVISARIAASGALVLFAVITVVAVSLSTIVSDNIEDEALRRYSARAQTEAAAIAADARDLLPSANLLARSLAAATEPARALRVLTDPDRPVTSNVAEQEVVTGAINQLIDEFVADQDPYYGPTLVIDRSGRVVAATPEPSNDFVVGISAQDAVDETRATPGDGAVDVALVTETDLVRLAVYPLRTAEGHVGVLVRTSIVNDSYLDRQLAPIRAEVDGASMVVATRGGILSRAGVGGDDDVARRLAVEALSGNQVLERTAGDRFYAAYPVSGSEGPKAALVLSAPRTEEDATREDLFRVLFLVSMGAATAALLLAGLAGEQIGSGLRRLGQAAAAIEGGNLDARADVRSDDELGALGRSFDSMAVSLGNLTRDLRRSALDEAALRARLEAVVGGMGEALVAVDGDGTITDFNAAAEELFDTPARDARGRPVTDVVQLRSDDGGSMARRLRRPVLEGWTDSGTVHTASGREIPVSISAGTLRGPTGEVAGAVFVLRDERRERELDRMKTEFLSNISHELRTPLTPIKGYASILRTRKLPAGQVQGFADEISVAADQLERVIGQLVSFSTIVGGRLSIDARPVAVRTFVDKVLGPWRERTAGTHRLVRQVPAGLRAPLDETFLAQALDAVIDNAVKYSPDGGRIVVAAAAVEGEEGRELEITVADQGVGIPADRIDTVLEDFSQVDSSTTRRFGGLGLGLALVNRVVRAHGGRLQVASTPGRGTTVTIRLPAPDAGRRAR